MLWYVAGLEVNDDLSEEPGAVFGLVIRCNIIHEHGISAPEANAVTEVTLDTKVQFVPKCITAKGVREHVEIAVPLPDIIDRHRTFQDDIRQTAICTGPLEQIHVTVVSVAEVGNGLKRIRRLICETNIHSTT